MRKQKGFSLIELLIVVAIILIIAAIAIPNLLRSRMSANEASAVGTVRAVITSENMFERTQDPPRYGTLAELYAANLLGSVPGTGIKSGYQLTVVTPDATSYDAMNTPQNLGTTGNVCYFANQTGIIRRAQGAIVCDANSPILQ